MTAGAGDPPAGATLAPGDAFAAALDRLTQELWAWSPSRFTPARIATLREMAYAWIQISRECGGNVPNGISLPQLEVHALADQLAILGADVLRSHKERAATEALKHLVAARAAIA